MKTLVIISALIATLSFSAKANMDCIYTASKSGITVRFTSPCFSEKHQFFIDSFINQLALKINRSDTPYNILVLINFEVLYYNFSGSPDYFTSLGVDTLREMNSNFINDYCYGRYGSTDQSRSNPLSINATDDKKASEKVGVKIIYNINYQKKIDWAEVEKLIRYAALNFDKIKSTQQTDTVRHYSWYVTLPTLDTIKINQIMGRPHNPPDQTLEKKVVKKNSMPYKPVIILVIGLLVFATVYKLKRQQNS